MALDSRNFVIREKDQSLRSAVPLPPPLHIENSKYTSPRDVTVTSVTLGARGSTWTYYTMEYESPSK